MSASILGVLQIRCPLLLMGNCMFIVHPLHIHSWTHFPLSNLCPYLPTNSIFCSFPNFVFNSPVIIKIHMIFSSIWHFLEFFNMGSYTTMMTTLNSFPFHFYENYSNCYYPKTYFLLLLSNISSTLSFHFTPGYVILWLLVKKSLFPLFLHLSQNVYILFSHFLFYIF